MGSNFRDAPGRQAEDRRDLGIQVEEGKEHVYGFQAGCQYLCGLCRVVDHRGLKEQHRRHPSDRQEWHPMP